MRYSPFPAVFRYLFPFSFFLFFQNTVVARNYSLTAPLLFVVAVVYKEKTQKILPMTAILVLLSHSSFMGFLIAGSILTVHLWDLRKEWSRLDKEARKRQGLALGLFCLSTLLLVLQLWKPEDVLAPEHSFDATKFRETAIMMMNNFLTENHLLSGMVLAVSLWWFYQRGVLLLYSLPTALLVIFFALLYGKPWHEASLFLVWLFALWISFEAREPAPLRARRAIFACLACVLGIHLYWSWHVYRNDYASAYSGSKEAAAFIEEHAIHEQGLYGKGFQAPAISPYFRKKSLKE
jgi:hypothetical protein